MKTTIENNKLYIFIIYLIASLITLAPLFLVEIPPFVDFPNHLARTYLLANFDNSQALQNNYYIDWNIIPNLAIDIVIPYFLLKFTDIYTAGKIFIFMIFFLQLGGVCLLRKSLFDRVGWYPLVFCIFFYNATLNWGFVNYMFTLGLCINFFALWIISENWKPLYRTLLFLLLPMILFFGHLLVLCIYASLIGSYELSKAYKKNDVIKFKSYYSLYQFVIPALLWFQVPPARHGDGPDGKLRTEWLPPQEKILELFVSLTYDNNDYTVIFILVFGVLLYLPVYQKMFNKYTRAIYVHNKLKFTALAFFLITLLMPSRLLGVAYVSLRFPVVLMMLIIASINIRPKTSRYFIAALCILFLINYLNAFTAILYVGNKFGEFKEKTNIFDRGSKILVVSTFDIDKECSICGHNKIYWQLSSLAVIEKEVFVPNFFTQGGAVRFKEENEKLTKMNLIYLPQCVLNASCEYDNRFRDWWQNEEERFWENWQNNFDYVLLYHYGNQSLTGNQYMFSVEQGTFFNIYKINK